MLLYSIYMGGGFIYSFVHNRCASACALWFLVGVHLSNKTQLLDSLLQSLDIKDTIINLIAVETIPTIIPRTFKLESYSALFHLNLYIICFHLATKRIPVSICEYLSFLSYTFWMSVSLSLSLFTRQSISIKHNQYLKWYFTFIYSTECIQF